MAEEAGLGEKELIDTLKGLKASGVIRRVAAVVSHRKTAYLYNAMVVWKVEEKDVERVGSIMASFSEVSHCYERDTSGYWNYKLYTMVHARSCEECMKSIESIAQKAGVNDYRVLFSKKEHKKTSFSVNS